MVGGGQWGTMDKGLEEKGRGKERRENDWMMGISPQ